MHLSELRGAAARAATGAAGNQRVHRKDEIGVCGRIYNNPRQLHFEIICDDENLQHIVGRRTHSFAGVREGRLDAIYGVAYFCLPAGTRFYAQRPANNEVNPSVNPVYSIPQGERLYISLRYANGNGAVNARGHGYLTTLREDGTPLSDPIEEPDAEYDLFSLAKSITATYSTAEQNRQLTARRHGQTVQLGPIPTPSAIVDLLRYGRAIWPDALNPVDVPHWRRVCYPGGEGWVNLNAADVLKFSDADFPPWCGWTLIDDDTDANSRCNSNRLIDIVRGNTGPNGRLTRSQLESRLQLDSVRNKMAKTICRVPSDWDRTSARRRWEWLLTDPDFLLAPADFEVLMSHVNALAFDWPVATIGIGSIHWHFHPREFIAHLRQCRWLSESELKQLIPSHTVRTAGRTVNWELISPRASNTNQNPILRTHRVSINRMQRKYGITSSTRQAAFFGNSVQETTWLTALEEGGGRTYWYSPWYGGGFLQLTHPDNYFNYWEWRGRTFDAALRTSLVNAHARVAAQPTAQRSSASIQDNQFPTMTQDVVVWRSEVRGGGRAIESITAPADSAGFYWLKSGMLRYADEDHLIERVAVGTNAGAKTYYRSLAFWRASAAVNLPSRVNDTTYRGLNGFDSRCSAYGVAVATLDETLLPDAQGTFTIQYPEGYTKRQI